MNKIIIANWKMHKTREEAFSYLEQISVPSEVVVKIAAPFTLLSELVIPAHKKQIEIIAQNMYAEKQGAFTGEVSAMMLKDLSVQTTLIGHSERRHIFHETNEDIQKKLERAIVEGMHAVLCVGETLEQREKGLEKETIEQQISSAIEGVVQADQITIAYEPVWAIGSNKTPEPETVNDIHAHIRQILEKYFLEDGKNIPILYGGSVSQDNIVSFVDMPNIDGALVGSASLALEKFQALLNNVKDVSIC